MALQQYYSSWESAAEDKSVEEEEEEEAQSDKSMFSGDSDLMFLHDIGDDSILCSSVRSMDYPNDRNPDTVTLEYIMDRLLQAGSTPLARSVGINALIYRSICHWKEGLIFNEFGQALTISKTIADTLQQFCSTQPSLHWNTSLGLRTMTPTSIEITKRGEWRWSGFSYYKQNEDDQQHSSSSLRKDSFQSSNTSIESCSSSSCCSQQRIISYVAPEALIKQNEKEGNSLEQELAYSFGIIMWQLISNNRLPYSTDFGGFSEIEFIEEVCVRGLRPEINSAWPTEIQMLLTKCFKTDPCERPSLQTITEELSSMMDNSCVLFREPSPSPSPSPSPFFSDLDQEPVVIKTDKTDSCSNSLKRGKSCVRPGLRDAGSCWL